MSSRNPHPEEEFSCPECCQNLRDPVVLSCSHRACRTCLQQFWDCRGSQECPVCWKRFSEEALQNSCKAFPESAILGSSEGSEGVCGLGSSEGSEGVCGLHSEKISLFCLEDQQLVCAECPNSDQHRNHTLRPTGEAAIDLKKQLQDALQENLDLLKTTKEDYGRTAAHIKVQADHTEQQIKQQFQKLQQFLRDEEVARIRALREEEEQKSGEVKRKSEELDGEISALSDVIRTQEEKIGADDVQFLQNFQSAENQVQPSIPENTSGNLINVSQHLSNLSFRVWEKMQEIIQYTPVTLDPNTAEDSLHLSEDLTEVEDTDGREPVPRNPERFDLYQCVLGSEGFNSGTHCWDVQVGDSEDWDVGVVSASVRRSGDSFWGSAWTLGYEENSNEYCVHRPGEPDHFFTPDQPVQSVRVQLDWEAGKLTFTDLQTNADLHSINHAFTEKLLPLFRNLSHAPLKILAAQTSVRVEQRNRII
uniref:Tripartite motif-containing protein 35-like n=1 Tax=Astyanax mexicanus TaxID=7994 RepID=A0A3B1IES2_ASTMX